MNLLNFECFVNDKKIDTLFYENDYNGKIINDPISAFINLKKICNRLKIEIIQEKQTIILLYNKFCINEYYLNNNSKNISIVKIATKNKKLCVLEFYSNENKLIKKDVWNESIIIFVQNEPYICFGIIRFLIDGCFLRNKNKITLYTPNFVNRNIPKSLIECYEYFDQNLDEKLIAKIKRNKLMNNRNVGKI